MSRNAIFAILIAAALLMAWRQRADNFSADDIYSEAQPLVTDIAFAPNIDEAPYQDETDNTPFRYKDVNVEPLYDFIVTARVLSKKYYRDEGAQYVPIDFALGWGRMADKTMLDKFDISQRNRWFYWQADEMPIPRKEVISSAANMHLIPADAMVKADMDDAEEGQVVQISGKLVRLRRDDGFRWNSSTSRNDSGGGACELVFVESFEIMEF